MIKYLLPLILICACNLLTAQDALPVAEVDSPPSLNYQDVDNASAEDAQEKLLLRAIYNQMRYPREARESGIMTAISARWLVNAQGELVIEEIKPLSEKEAMVMPESEGNIVVTAYAPGKKTKGRILYRVDHSELSKRQQREQRKLNLLVEAVRSVLGELPRFQAGTQAGTPVTTRYEQLFLFRIE